MNLHLVAQSLPLILEGAEATVILFFGSLALGTLLGLVLALMRLAPFGPLRWFSASFVAVFRGLPALIVLFFTYYGLPYLGVRIDAMQAGILGLGVDAAAYKAEIIRSGILSVDAGQWEASEALAMSKWHYMRRVIVPQSIRIMLPPYMSNAITLLKSTSLASVITVAEITGVANRIISSTFEPMEILAVVGLLYLSMAMVLVLVQQFLEHRYALKT